jgi:pimeloyl-ACP methyl ester carboxylesterase
VSDDVVLHVEQAGEGPVVVLGHGFGGSARNFRPQVRALRDRYRVVVFDARGHARSGAPDEAAAYAPGRFVADLERVVDGAGAAEAVVGGLSMGAAVALAFAQAHPSRVRGLVLASFPAADGGLAARARDFADCLEREGLEAAGARFVWGGEPGADGALVRQGFLEHSPRALAHVLRELIAEQADADALAPQLAGLRVPALVVAGERDAPSLEASRRLAEVLPEAQLVVLESAGHVVNLQRPRHFNDALLGFLDSL